MKKYLFTGLIIFLPIVITILIALFLFDLFTNPFVGIIQHVLETFHLDPNHNALIFFLARLASLLLVLLFIVFLGVIAQHFFSKWIIHLVDKLFLRVPVIKSIYKISTEITKSVFQTEEKPFKKTVLLKFPNTDATAYGFLTGKVPYEVEEKEKAKSSMHSVFLPTAPHPISGFLIMVQSDLLQEVDLSVEDIFKTLVSCGLYIPPNKEKPNETKTDLPPDKK